MVAMKLGTFVVARGTGTVTEMYHEHLSVNVLPSIYELALSSKSRKPDPNKKNA